MKVGVPNVPEHILKPINLHLERDRVNAVTVAAWEINSLVFCFALVVVV